jgi:hypothetical protein
MAGEIRLGTSSFTADGWNGAFYPKNVRDYHDLSHLEIGGGKRISQHLSGTRAFSALAQKLSRQDTG